MINPILSISNLVKIAAYLAVIVIVALFVTPAKAGEFRICSADVDHSGQINIYDITYISAHFHTYVTPYAPGDADGTGYIDIFDLTYAGSHYGENTPCVN